MGGDTHALPPLRQTWEPRGTPEVMSSVPYSVGGETEAWGANIPHRIWITPQSFGSIVTQAAKALGSSEEGDPFPDLGSDSRTALRRRLDIIHLFSELALTAPVTCQAGLRNAESIWGGCVPGTEFQVRTICFMGPRGWLSSPVLVS